MKILFACDLDNTLIHSYKKRRADDICVEIYDGHEQSFISPRALELVKKIAAQILFVPVTTRSIAQYRRIFWTEDFRPRQAVVTNGAFLLDGDNQENFLKKVVAPYEAELKLQHENFSDNPAFDICRIVDESFLYLRCRDDIDADKISFDTSLTVQGANKKFYLFPPELNKGAALERLIEKFSPDKTFAAGDSVIDTPMLEVADISFGKGFIEFSAAENFLEKILRALNV
ncbi:MAG: HAD hydrolase family protein [Selenomonadaceae bacterium]|nr:HAD hydrolase family protein [Selenomonadaceae bacterium]